MVHDQAESKLVAIFVQGILYGGRSIKRGRSQLNNWMVTFLGAFVIMFLLTYWTLVYRRPPGRRLNKAMLGVSITMVTLATIHVVLNFIRIRKAFIESESTYNLYWKHLSEPMQIVSSTVYIAQTTVGDGVALYRCYVVWSRRLRYLVVPALAFCGSIAAGAGTIVTLARFTRGQTVYLRQWIAAFFSFTLATSTTCTLMIAARIWYLNRGSVDGQPGGNLRPVVRIVLESGAIYSGTLILLLVLFETKSRFQYALMDAVSPIVGLVFSIIIVRVSLRITTDGPSPFGSTAYYHESLHSKSGIHSRPVSYVSRPPPSAPSPAPSALWPAQPNRPTSPPRRPCHGQTKVFGFNSSQRGRGQGHYNLRSQTERPSSYFRTSGDMEIDSELEFEFDEARYRQPKALPVALMLPQSERDLVH